MMFGINACEGCTICAACERTYCRDNDVSPGEADGICRDCWDLEDTRTEAELLAAWVAEGWAS